MKVLNLGCLRGHLFEGWFGSEADFQDQLARGLLECPLCGDRSVSKRLSAPRLNLKSGTEPAQQTERPPAELPPEAARLQAAALHAMRELVAKSEDVGERFADEARAMQRGDAEPRRIRGRASVAEAVELIEEGVPVLPLPDLAPLKETLQ